MKAILRRNPDMLLETLALLYLEPNLAEDANPLHSYFDSEACKDLHSRYVAAFHARKKTPADWQTFADTSAGEYLILMFTAMQVKDFLFQAQGFSADTLLSYLNTAYRFARDSGVPFIDFGSADTVTAYVSSPNCSAAFREILQNPFAYFSLLYSAVRDNISATELAWDSVRTEVRAFADKYWQEDYFFSHSVLSADSNIREICPMLAVPFSAVILGDVCYCGFYNVDTSGAISRTEEKDFLCNALKALSDPKRLDIAVLIAQTPRYNRELAQLTELSPATVMHHTDKLLQCGLVSIVTDPNNQKKIYFKIEPQKIKLLQKAIGDLLG